MSVVRKMGEHLLLELRPVSAGYDGNFRETKQSAEQCGHLGVDRRLAFGKRAIEIENNQFFHFLAFPSGSEMSNNVIAPLVRQQHAPTTAGKRKTSPRVTA